ncbi:hypothetical protein TNCV_4859351 [Trichonephila clavipes]|nr:hypothetical protein TNCV_4859351 [Trichonephila clavipes]
MWRKAVTSLDSICSQGNGRLPETRVAISWRVKLLLPLLFPNSIVRKFTPPLFVPSPCLLPSFAQEILEKTVYSLSLTKQVGKRISNLRSSREWNIRNIDERSSLLSECVRSV